MTTESNGAVTPEAPTALKSTDTSVRATLTLPKAEPAKDPEAKTPATEPKVEPSIEPPEGEQGHAPDADASTPPATREKRLPRWMKERLERERQVTEARTREAMLREFQERQPPNGAPVTTPEPPKLKTIEDFDFDQQRYTDYLVDTKLAQREEQQRLQAEHTKQAEATQSFKARVDAFEERAGDGAWEDIITSPVNTDPAYKPLTELFMGDEHDLDIAHYLATNPKEAERLKTLPRLAQVREIAKLAEKFDGGSTEPEVTTPSTPPPKPQRTTTAPPPPRTITGAGKPSVDINDPNLTTAQRIAAWRSKGR